MSLCRDQQGNIWAGTEGDGIYKLDPRTGESKQFTTADGLGDDNGYAIACDLRGRIWAGHLRHGLSVYDGQRWQNYDVVGGLSRPDSLNGPLGEHVFHIAVNPKDGDVWIATSCGLTRYSDAHDAWQYYTRSDGLSSDQASSLAVDSNGIVYLATQCNGIDVAEPKDDYRSWRHSAGPAILPTIPRGDGLPSNLINDIIASRDGTVYAATSAGLAWSKTRGRSWQFLRGADWADKVRGLAAAAPRKWTETKSETLAEDYCTCLAEDNHANIWIGHRTRGPEILNSTTGRTSEGLDNRKLYAKAILACDAETLVGCCGDGLVPESKKSALSAAAMTPPAGISKLPSGAAPPAADDALAPSKLVVRRSQTGHLAEYLGDDWQTQGDWTGRFGTEHAMLCSVMAPMGDQELSLLWNCRVGGQMGPNHAKGDSLRHWISRVQTDDARTLYDPALGIRRQAEWDDHGEAVSANREGPDVDVSVRVPAGAHRLSLYFMNNDGNSGANRYRDYLVELRSATNGSVPLISTPPLASARVVDFRGGVYKQFEISGPGDYVVRISRNYSFNTICSGIFIDGWPAAAQSPPGLTYSYMADVKYGPMAKTGSGPTTAFSSSPPGARISTAEGQVGQSARAMGILKYRNAIRSGISDTDSSRWRWELHLWTPDDRNEFAMTMAAAWHRMQDFNPALRQVH